MTDEQVKKAEKAIRDKQTQKLIQQVALHHRQHVMEAVKLYCLPYRILYDSRGYDDDERRLNRYYPKPGLPRAARLQTTEAISIYTADDAIYYCSRFLRYEDFSSYKAHDFTGAILPPDELEVVRGEYKKRQEDYLRSLGSGRYYDHILFPNKKQENDEREYYCFYGG